VIPYRREVDPDHLHGLLATQRAANLFFFDQKYLNEFPPRIPMLAKSHPWSGRVSLELA
jgi:hypothetical protein